MIAGDYASCTNACLTGNSNDETSSIYYTCIYIYIYIHSLDRIQSILIKLTIEILEHQVWKTYLCFVSHESESIDSETKTQRSINTSLINWWLELNSSVWWVGQKLNHIRITQRGEWWPSCNNSYFFKQQEWTVNDVPTNELQ